MRISKFLSITTFIFVLGAGAVTASLIQTAEANAGRPSRATSGTRAANWVVQIDSKTYADVRVSAPIISEVEVIEYQDGDDLFLRKRAGRPQAHDITLSGKGKPPKEFLDKFKSAQNGQMDRWNLVIAVKNAEGQTVFSHQAPNSFPRKFTIVPSSGSWSMTVETEELKLFQ